MSLCKGCEWRHCIVRVLYYAVLWLWPYSRKAREDLLEGCGPHDPSWLGQRDLWDE